VQRGDQLVLDYTAPALTTDDIGTSSFSAAEVHIGEDAVQVAEPKPGLPAHVEIPVRQWIGKEAPIHVILAGAKGQRSKQSNVVVLRIVEPVPIPSNLQAEPHPEGVRVRWTSSAPPPSKFRVRRDPPAEAIVDTPEFIDRGVEAGTVYKYSVVAISGNSESLPSAEVSVTPKDVFPPSAPVNLAAIAGVNTVELNWDRSADPDLKSYRVYRNDAVVMQDLDTPSFSDKQVKAGERYRYAVTAVDQAGNESAKSAVVEVTAQ
jgi:hypothetical protein